MILISCTHLISIGQHSRNKLKSFNNSVRIYKKNKGFCKIWKGHKIMNHYSN